MTDHATDPLIVALECAAARLGDHGPDGAVRLATGFGIRGYVVRQLGVADSPDGARLFAGLIERSLMDAATEISRELTRSDIAHFFVKGIALADRVYRPGDREMADIDLHVRPHACSAALAVLEGLGYESLPDVEQGAPEVMRAGVALYRGTIGPALDHVAVDLRWGLDPVDRLLPRNDTPVPDSIWQSIDVSGPIPVPSDAAHATLVTHHLVHHDMLHVRGLLDLCLLWDRLDSDAGGTMEALARDLRVVRALRLLAYVLSHRLGRPARGVAGCPTDVRGRWALGMMEPVAWMTWAARAPGNEFVEVTARRVARRVLFLDDRRSVAAVIEDAILPPEPYLRWRWPLTRSLAAARLKHLSRMIGKSVSGAAGRGSIAAPQGRS